MVVGILIDGKTMNITDDHFTEMSICPENFIGLSIHQLVRLERINMELIFGEKILINQFFY